MINRILLAILSLFTIPFAFSQATFPENGALFIDTVVPRIDITINPDTLSWLYANTWSYTEFHADFVFDNGSVRDTIKSVGFRLRGNTSRQSNKKSFKVSFNTFTKGGKYYGVEKLNLNGEHNDPSIMRSKVMWDILRKWGIPAPRANHVQVYINGDYYGLYINVEHIDEEFVESRFGNKDGNLYKCTWPANLNYLGSDPNLYKDWGDQAYELITNTLESDYSDLATFIDIINRTSEADLVCKLNELFNTYDYLKVIAADIFCGNWDGYYNKNNFYLYHNTKTNKLEYIPYDVDNTFGIDWFDEDWGAKNIYNWQPGGNEKRPLYNQLINNPELRKQFTHYVNILINNTFDIDVLIASIEVRKNMIAPYVQNDPYHSLDYGYTYDDFLNSYNQPTGGHVKYGLYPYLIARTISMNSQIEASTMLPIIKYISHRREAGQILSVKATVETEAAPAHVVVLYSVDEGAFQETEMFEGESGDYLTTIDNISLESEIKYQIKVTDFIDQEQILPCQPYTISPILGEKPLLFINEFMASNNFAVSDEYGNYSDWIEIYNGDIEAVFLGDFYLSDNLSKPDKWKMPNVSLAVGDYALFWADGDSLLGDHHADFKLSKYGEEIGIFNSEGYGIDTLSFGQQTEDISFGRFPDGSIEWEFFNFPSPGASNIASTVGIDEITFGDQLTVYPNPANGSMIYLNQRIDCKVFNSSGQIVFLGSNIKDINISQFSRGLYVIVSESGLRTKFIVQ